MANVFSDQAKFMKACEQTTDEENLAQFKLYADLITEEYDELRVAIANKDKVETLDALLDIIVVATGAIHSLGVDAEGAWKEVMSSNFAKVDPQYGKVLRRPEDGKVLKPEGWKPPELAQYINKS